MTESDKDISVRLAENATDGSSVKVAQTIDTTHKDEALRVLQAYQGNSTWSDEEENKLRRKIDWKLMPVLCATYGLQYYDKAMLSQAALFGLREDLGLLVGGRYAFSASIFYLGFIAGAYPAMILAQRFPIERVASAIVALWGICLILTTACQGYQTLYTQRFFLGFLESGISPMFMLIVGSFYRKNEQAMRMGIWYSCTGYVSIFSPLVNYGFGLINGGVSSWRYMYYFSGSLTILWGLILFFVLPPDPIRARGFNERERYILVARLRTNNSGVRNTHLKISQVWELLLDAKFWVIFSIGFFIHDCERAHLHICSHNHQWVRVQHSELAPFNNPIRRLRWHHPTYHALPSIPVRGPEIIPDCDSSIRNNTGGAVIMATPTVYARRSFVRCVHLAIAGWWVCCAHGFTDCKYGWLHETIGYFFWALYWILSGQLRRAFGLQDRRCPTLCSRIYRGSSHGNSSWVPRNYIPKSLFMDKSSTRPGWSHGRV